MINHSHSFGWDRSPVRVPWLIRHYGITLPSVDSGYSIGSHWLTQVGETLYWNTLSVAACTQPFSGAILVNAMQGGEMQGHTTIAAQCGNGMLLLTGDGQFIETLLNQPEAISAIGLQGTQLVAKGADANYAVDLENGTWHNTSSLQPIAWRQAQPLPAEIQHDLEQYNIAPDLTWERILLDFHSGRLFGNLGSFLVDLLGVSLILSAITGWWIWRTSSRHQ